MSTVNAEKIIKESYREIGMTETYSFKMTPEMKEQLITLCNERSLSPGKVLRGLLGQFLNSANEL